MIGKEDRSGVADRSIGSRAFAPAACTLGVRTWGALTRPALAIALLAACSHASKPSAPGCCDKSGPGGTEDGGADAAPPLATAAPKPPPRFRLEDGCARDFKASGDSGRDLAELERLCAQGLAPILGPAENTRAFGVEPVEVAFRVTGSTACLRAGALGIAPGQILSLENARGAVLATAVATDTLGVVPVDGTVCVREAGAFKFVLKPAPSPPPSSAASPSEARTLSVQVWQASRD
jgi:hypothetical protein